MYRGGNRIVFIVSSRLIVIGVAQVALMANLPQAKVEASIDVAPQIVIAQMAVCVFGVVKVGIVAQKQRGFPGVPFGDRDESSWRM